MQFHTIQPDTPKKSKKRIGRGGKRGKTSGRGHKGQKARAGNSGRTELRDIIKRIPKLRGYRFSSIQTKPLVVNVGDLDRVFSAGEEVNPQTLAQHKLITTKKSARRAVKILGDGELSKKLSITGCSVSASARTKIESAGGIITDEEVAKG